VCAKQLVKSKVARCIVCKRFKARAGQQVFTKRQNNWIQTIWSPRCGLCRTALCEIKCFCEEVIRWAVHLCCNQSSTFGTALRSVNRDIPVSTERIHLQERIMQGNLLGQCKNVQESWSWLKRAVGGNQSAPTLGVLLRKGHHLEVHYIASSLVRWILGKTSQVSENMPEKGSWESFD
jgi:hypothetical protein